MSEPARQIKVRPRRGGRGLLLLEEVGTLIGHSEDVRSTLERITSLVAVRLDMEVCSIYGYTPATQRLILLASKGLDPGSVGRVAMGVDEGLTGFVIQKGEPVMAIDALAHPRYKYFPETGEEKYHSFLGVPIFDKKNAVGVLVVQTSRRRRFTREEVRLLKTVSVPVGGLLVQLHLLRSLASKEEERVDYHRRMTQALKRLQKYERQKAEQARPLTAMRLLGLPAAPGFGLGRAHLLTPQVTFGDIPRRRPRSARKELASFRAAVARSRQELMRLKERVQTSLPEIDARVFDAHDLMLADPSLTGRVEKRIEGGASAEAALEEVVNEMVAEFGRFEEQYLRERAFDVKDIGQRILRNLLGVAEPNRSFASGVVLVAEELSLSEVLHVEREQLKGIVIGAGGVTSHASIFAKSMEIPTVVGAGGIEDAIHEGDHLIVDGNAGTVYVNPSPEVLGEYERLKREYTAFNRELDNLRELPAVTRDGCHVTLGANIGLLGDLELALRHGADGIGLYRTELAFLSHRDFLTEDEQIELYGRVVRGAAGMPVSIRTLDLGADKYPSYLHVPQEANPFLGWRSIRISLEMADIFKVQLRAILRASVLGPVRILFPMISSLDEIRRVKELLAEAGDELQLSGHPFNPQMPIGIMIEVPAAVGLADRLIEEVDFFSIGTNDLIQYILAVDRNNRKVADLYEPLHPAVLRAVAETVRIADAANKPVSLCGEMAADPMCSLILLGMGLKDLSMSSFFIPVIKRLIRSIDLGVAERLAEEVVNLSTAQEVKGRVFETMRALDVVDLIEMYH